MPIASNSDTGVGDGAWRPISSRQWAVMVTTPVITLEFARYWPTTLFTLFDWIPN